MQPGVELVLFCCQYVTHHSVHIYGINTLVLVEIWVGLFSIALVSPHHQLQYIFPTLLFTDRDMEKDDGSKLRMSHKNDAW